MGKEKVVKTVVCGLQTSNRKNEVLRGVIDDWQRVASHCADVAVGYKYHNLKGHTSALYRETENVEDTKIHSRGRQEASAKVSDAFVSWYKQPQNNNHPKSKFGDGDYCRFTNQEIEIKENDDEKFAIKVNLIPYNPEWFKLYTGEHQEEILEECVNGERKPGAFEIHYNNGRPQLHLAVTKEFEVLEPEEVETYVGVDLGENVLYALGTDEPRRTEIEDGAEFRHHREKLSLRKDREQSKGNLKKVKDISGERLKYTDWVTHTASRDIVRRSSDFDNPCIVLEDLNGYRETKGEYAIHDWPYAETQEKILYKATEKGIPVVKVDPAYTSQLCNKCKEKGNREGNKFYCSECDYEIHADINASFNIADRGKKEHLES